MSLETHIAASEDRLIDSLHFAGRNTASYIVARRASTFHPSSVGLLIRRLRARIVFACMQIVS